jgi:hypothetical protein
MSTSGSVAKPRVESTETSPVRRRLHAQAVADERHKSDGSADKPGQGEGSEPAVQRALGDTEHQAADGERAQCRTWDAHRRAVGIVCRRYHRDGRRGGDRGEDDLTVTTVEDRWRHHGFQYRRSTY